MEHKNLLSYQEDGSPYSTKFGDVYFDTNNGYQQSQRVFIEQNKIFERLSSHKKNHNRPFTIIETGFGTGLNFLLTLQVYQKVAKTRSDPTHLHFISLEKYPLSAKQLSRSLSLWPELSEYSQPLLAQYPQDFNSPATFLFFNGQVSLTLYFGDATDSLTTLSPQKRIVDAWYLDGFSPHKNPDMWSKNLFKEIERLSQEQATLSTFTIAGQVRRNLIEAGFRVEKYAMQGHKKEALSAIFQQSPSLGKGYQIRPKVTKPMHVSIIGGGIASACAAYALTKQGIKVTLYCQDSSLAQGASSNKIGALFPLLHQKRDEISEFYEQAFWRAKALYTQLFDDGFHFAHQWCGLLEISYKEVLQKRQEQFANIGDWDPSLITSVNAEQASEHAGISLPHGGLFMPNAGWIAPAELVKALCEAAKKTNRLKIETYKKIKRITQLPDHKWQMHGDDETITTDTLIVCMGAQTQQLNILDDLPLSSVRGQISNMKANSALSQLSTVICHKGYITPSDKGIQCIGATFDKNTFDIDSRDIDDQYNLSMLDKCLPELPSWRLEDVSSNRARLRCMTPDHLPMVGAVPKTNEHISLYQHLRKDKNWKFYEVAPHYKNLYVLTGLGARGLCSAPLLADILAADLTGSPYPVDNKILFNLAPNRFIIRDLIKRKI